MIKHKKMTSTFLLVIFLLLISSVKANAQSEEGAISGSDTESIESEAKPVSTSQEDEVGIYEEDEELE
ncbi:MAG: hypothetical protein N4A33_11770 [Bacteriovoracaceae bacterium]|jgi:hypothetical protein|nr:hypothetical protein [Bacteriovoracaceae bacterium]